jgi:hypothetical protein
VLPLVPDHRLLVEQRVVVMNIYLLTGPDTALNRLPHRCNAALSSLAMPSLSLFSEPFSCQPRKGEFVGILGETNERMSGTPWMCVNISATDRLPDITPDSSQPEGGRAAGSAAGSEGSYCSDPRIEDDLKNSVIVPA